MSENVKDISMEEEKDLIKNMIHMVNPEDCREIRETLNMTEKGTVKNSMENYVTVLRKDPLLAGSLRYNRLTEKIDVTKILWWNKEPCVLTNKGRKALRYFFEKYYGLFNESVTDDALGLEAYSREYHPICEYLENLEWDGKERIRNVLKVYMGAEDSDMVYEMLKHFMMGALNRIYCPGCKFDEMLCLVGQQGAGKSTFFRFLALDDQWFSDSLKNLNMEKPYELLRGHWILEMSEMTAAISAKSIEETKFFLSRMKETHRNPYEKYEEDYRLKLIAVKQRSTFLIMSRKPESILTSCGQKQWYCSMQLKINRTYCGLTVRWNLIPMSIGNSSCRKIQWQE